MERDKLIAIVLVVGLVFLFVAFLGVIAVTGFVIFFLTPQGDAIDNTPIIDSIGTTTTTTPPTTITQPPNTTADDSTDNTPTNNDEPEEPEEEPIPEPEPVESTLTTLKVDSLIFVPTCVNLDGTQGLGLSQIILKNTGSSDFTYNGSIKISSKTDNLDDQITTKTINLTVKAGKTERVYMNQAIRTEKFLFLGNKIGSLELTLKFGNDIVVHTQDLRGQDFANANCI